MYKIKVMSPKNGDAMDFFTTSVQFMATQGI